MKIFMPLAFLCLIMMTSCFSIKGEFAIKTLLDESYRRVNEQLEIEKDKDVQWVYKFKSTTGKYKIGVILLKKEIFWADVQAKVEIIEGKKNIIYGTISRLPVGEYRIVLTDVEKKNALIDELHFIIYSDEEDD